MISWFTPLYLLAIYGVIRYFTKPKQKLFAGKINWEPLESIGVTLAIYFGAQIIGGALAYLAPMIIGWDNIRIANWLENSVIGKFVLIMVIETLMLWFLYKFLKRRETDFKALGLKKASWIDVGWALLGFIAYFLLYIITVSLIKRLVPSLNLDQEQQIGFNQAAGVQLIIVFVSLVIVPVIVEELLVRGFLYSGLKKGLPHIWAVLITSGLFAIAHLKVGSGMPLLWVAAIDTFVLSLVLIYLRDKTGKLWAPISLHMIKNFVAFMALFVFR